MKTIQYKGAQYLEISADNKLGAVAAKMWSNALGAIEDLYNDTLGLKKRMTLFNVRHHLSNLASNQRRTLSTKEVTETKKAVALLFSPPSLAKMIALSKKNGRPEHEKYDAKRLKLINDGIKKLKSQRKAFLAFLDDTSAKGKANVVAAKKKALAIIKSIKVPEGFTLETKDVEPDKMAGAYRYVEVMLKKEGEIEIKIEFMLSHHGKAGDWDKNLASGHTRFKTEKGWLTYDRHGVEDSFYLDEGEDLNEKIAKQLDKIKVSQERQKTTQAVPGLGFLLTPETIEKHKKTLASGETISLAPSGFGTGYFLSKSKRPGTHPGSSELAKFFGLDEIFVSEFDHD